MENECAKNSSLPKILYAGATIKNLVTILRENGNSITGDYRLGTQNRPFSLTDSPKIALEHTYDIAVLSRFLFGKPTSALIVLTIDSSSPNLRVWRDAAIYSGGWVTRSLPLGSYLVVAGPLGIAESIKNCSLDERIVRSVARKAVRMTPKERATSVSSLVQSYYEYFR